MSVAPWASTWGEKLAWAPAVRGSKRMRAPSLEHYKNKNVAKLGAFLIFCSFFGGLFS